MVKRGGKILIVVLCFLFLVVFSTIFLVQGQNSGNLEQGVNSAAPTTLQQNFIEEDNSLENLDPLSKGIKEISIKENSYLEGKNVFYGGSFSDNLPKEILRSSQSFVETIVDRKDIDKNLYLDRWFTVEDSSKKVVEYLLIYSLIIESYRKNGKKTISEYPLNLVLEEEGTIVHEDFFRDKYNYIKMRES
jgi:hypothetical protein